jgi:hypothetical protein
LRYVGGAVGDDLYLHSLPLPVYNGCYAPAINEN